MNAVRVIERELRAESRRPVNYWLRVFAAAGIIVVFTSFMLTTQMPQAWLGQGLFVVLHWTLSLGSWIFVPLMTADCVPLGQTPDPGPQPHRLVAGVLLGSPFDEMGMVPGDAFG